MRSLCEKWNYENRGSSLSIGLYFKFNQRQNGFALASNMGIQRFDCFPFQPTTYHHLDEDRMSHIAMQFETNMIAVVRYQVTPFLPPYHVVIKDITETKAEIVLEFKNRIKSVQLNSNWIIVELFGHIEIYEFTEKPERAHRLKSNCNSPVLCALGASNMLVYTVATEGQVRIVYLTKSEVNTLTITAHKNPIDCIAMNFDETRIATASNKGIKIRVFDTLNGKKVAELRRGFRPDKIHYMSFNSDSTKLCVSAGRGIHVFRLSKGNFIKFFYKTISSYFKYSLPTRQGFCTFSNEDKAIILISSGAGFSKLYFNDKGECLEIKHEQIHT